MAEIFILPTVENFTEAIPAIEKSFRDLAAKAARGECEWVCPDCCSKFSKGMPDECAHGQKGCTDLIRRDKNEALSAEVMSRLSMHLMRQQQSIAFAKLDAAKAPRYGTDPKDSRVAIRINADGSENLGEFDAEMKLTPNPSQTKETESSPGSLDLPVMSLVWSDEPPNNDCRYNHAAAVTPFGRVLITWKGWREYVYPTIDETPWGEFGGSFSTVEEAKAAVQAEYTRRVLLCLQ
jgi:hypothetical protein